MELEQKIEILRRRAEGLAFETAVLPTERVVFAAEVREACARNACGRYGKSWTCPPGVGELADLREKYGAFSHVFVLTTRHPLEDSFDFEGMTAAGQEHNRIAETVLCGIREFPNEVLIAHGCNRCEHCTYPDAPCRFPELAKPSGEACGIDVVALAGAANVHYYGGPNTVTYFSVLFF